MRYPKFLGTLLLGLLLLLATAANAQYSVTNLVSNVTGGATTVDPLLANPWGLVYAPGSPFWISDEASGWSTLYNGSGAKVSLNVVVPAVGGSGPGTPTGIVFNGSSQFQINGATSIFIFATLDGTISGWNPANIGSSLIGVTQPGASFTGLAITNYSSGNHIYAADAANDVIDMYDGNFKLVGQFTDVTVPDGFAPFGIQDIGGKLYVTFAATNGQGGGYISIFTEQGEYVKRFASGSVFNQPWGLAVAPSTFGPLSGALLVTNNATIGTINAFNLKTGKFIDVVRHFGQPVSINGIWGIEFGGGTANDGPTNWLYFTAGPNDTDGYFGFIEVQQ
jgi:uncharacterized protein (TIGR03118 family)